MSNRHLGNWVDRGESPHRQLTRVLVRFLALDPKVDASTLAAHCETIIAFVAADGSEVQLADYLAELQRSLGRDVSPGPNRRYVAIALWHIAKVALVRENLANVRATDTATSANISLSEWLAQRLSSEDA